MKALAVLNAGAWTFAVVAFFIRDSAGGAAAAFIALPVSALSLVGLAVWKRRQCGGVS